MQIKASEMEVPLRCDQKTVLDLNDHPNAFMVLFDWNIKSFDAFELNEKRSFGALYRAYQFYIHEREPVTWEMLCVLHKNAMQGVVKRESQFNEQLINDLDIVPGVPRTKTAYMTIRLGMHLTEAGFEQLKSLPYSDWIKILKSPTFSHDNVLKTIEDVQGNNGFISLSASKDSSYVMTKAKTFIAEFNACIGQVEGPAKLKTIITLCKRLTLLHPFPDGNIRSFSVCLLNKLLVDSGFSPTMWFDPNYLEGHTEEELVPMIIAGQYAYRNICSDTPEELLFSELYLKRFSIDNPGSEVIPQSPLSARCSSEVISRMDREDLSMWLSYACMYDIRPLALLLVRASSLSSKHISFAGNNPIILACYYGHIDLLKSLYATNQEDFINALLAKGQLGLNAVQWAGINNQKVVLAWLKGIDLSDDKEHPMDGVLLDSIEISPNNIADWVFAEDFYDKSDAGNYHILSEIVNRVSLQVSQKDSFFMCLMFNYALSEAASNYPTAPIFHEALKQKLENHLSVARDSQQSFSLYIFMIIALVLSDESIIEMDDNSSVWNMFNCSVQLLDYWVLNKNEGRFKGDKIEVLRAQLRAKSPESYACHAINKLYDFIRLHNILIALESMIDPNGSYLQDQLEQQIQKSQNFLRQDEIEPNLVELSLLINQLSKKQRKIFGQLLPFDLLKVLDNALEDEKPKYIAAAHRICDLLLNAIDGPISFSFLNNLLRYALGDPIKFQQILACDLVSVTLSDADLDLKYWRFSQAFLANWLLECPENQRSLYLEKLSAHIQPVRVVIDILLIACKSLKRDDLPALDWKLILCISGAVEFLLKNPQCLAQLLINLPPPAQFWSAHLKEKDSLQEDIIACFLRYYKKEDIFPEQQRRVQDPQEAYSQRFFSQPKSSPANDVPGQKPDNPRLK